MNAIYVHVLSKRLTVLLCIELHYIIIIIILVETFIFFAIVMYGLLHKVAGFIFVLFFYVLTFSLFLFTVNILRWLQFWQTISFPIFENCLGF